MARNSLRVAASAAAALMASLTIGLATAEATRTVRIASQISIRSHGLTFSGKVTSSNPGCVVHRKVTLYRTNGDVLGTAKSGLHGHWKITAQGSAGITLGKFYAKVKRRSEGTAGTIFVCKRAKSKTIPFHQ
jgi:hypothetical protein